MIFPHKSRGFFLNYFNDFSLAIESLNDKKLLLYLVMFVTDMPTQGMLLPIEACMNRSVCWEAIKVDFVEVATSTYEAFLEVSSNKFLVRMVKDENGIQSFEIIAMKGFMEITTKIIDLLKRLVVHLWEMVD